MDKNAAPAQRKQIIIKRRGQGPSYGYYNLLFCLFKIHYFKLKNTSVRVMNKRKQHIEDDADKNNNVNEEANDDDFKNDVDWSVVE